MAVKDGKVAVVDETVVKFAGQHIYLWVALDPDSRALIWLDMSLGRSYGEAYEFLRELRKRGVRTIITDKGAWYRRAAALAGLQHVVMSGGERSYVERVIETIKDRLRGFDVCFPSRRYLLNTAIEWLHGFMAFYNYVRTHMTLGREPVQLFRGPEWLKMLFLVEKAWEVT